MYQGIIDTDRVMHSDRERRGEKPLNRRRGGDRPSGRQRERVAYRDGQYGSIVIVQHALMTDDMMRPVVHRPVGLRVPVKEQFVMAVLLGFVDVLGRREGHKAHRSREYDAENTAGDHEGHATRLPRTSQLKSR